MSTFETITKAWSFNAKLEDKTFEIKNTIPMEMHKLPEPKERHRYPLYKMSVGTSFEIPAHLYKKNSIQVQISKASKKLNASFGILFNEERNVYIVGRIS